MAKKTDAFEMALRDKKIPILTLDHNWHILFNTADTTTTVLELEEQVNELLKKQGKLNTQIKDIKRLKKKLMDEIMSLAEERSQAGDAAVEKKIAENKRLIEECNEKLDQCQDGLLDIQPELTKANYLLMLATMDTCYDKLHENTQEIDEIGEWITKIRIELKKKIIRKQEKEATNQQLYAYMHSIFGADVIDLFDMKYNPEDRAPKPAKESDSKGEEKK